jgi:hypothetical protein
VPRTQRSAISAFTRVFDAHAEDATSLYLDRHHLTPYGAMWVHDQAFKPLTDFASGLRN